MKHLKSILLAAPLLVLAGCNSGSSSNTNNNVDKNSKVTKPAADYKFSQKDVDALMSERKVIFDALRVTYAGTSYENVLFAESMSEEILVIKLADADKNTIDLVLSSDDAMDCMIYRAKEPVQGFKCDETKQSTSGENTLIQSTITGSSTSIQVEFNVEAPEFLPSIGSTVLTATHADSKVDIVTSFAFNDLYRDAFSMTSDKERIHSTLGATTYLQLSDIVKNYSGTEMTFKFNNNIGGSADDDINLYTGLMIHDNNMTTMVTKTGSVFSGGTDLFAAGKKRVLQRKNAIGAFEGNKQVGVHSWAQGDKEAKAFPFTHESHRRQATFFNKVMGDKGIDFYLFTLDAAPAAGEHWITKADSDKYGFITEIQ